MGDEEYHDSFGIMRGLGKPDDFHVLFSAVISDMYGCLPADVHADIRHSIWLECTDRVDGHELGSSVRIADSTMEMEHGKNIVHAHGFKKSSSDRTAKLKSLAGYTDAFIEEAEEIGEDEFRQLDDSLRVAGSQIHLMLNTPSKGHWIIKRWFNVIPATEAPGFFTLELKPEFADKVEFIFSDHTRNPYIAEEVHERSSCDRGRLLPLSSPWYLAVPKDQ